MKNGITRSFMSPSGNQSVSSSTSLPQHQHASIFNGNVSPQQPQQRKVPAKAASFSILRHDTSPLLPDRSPEAMRMHPFGSPDKLAGRNTFRAAESGKRHLLPTSASSNSMMQSSAAATASLASNNQTTSSIINNRSRASSTNSFTTTAGNRRNHTTPPEQLQQMTQSLLRSRKRSGGSTNWMGGAAVSDDEGGSGLPSYAAPPPPDYYRGGSGGPQQQQQHHNHRSVKPSWSDNFGKTDKPTRRRDLVMCLARSTLTIRRAHVVQAAMTCLVAFFIWDSYQKALATTEQLLIVKHEESMMLLHLRRLEEQSLNLHESIARLSQGSVGIQPVAAGAADQEGGGGSESFDGEIIKIQAKQLREMEDELDHEVKTLQAKIQHSDRANIVRTFGEGPVQVVLDVSFPQAQHDSSKISILLWYDTPHAAWTLIDQLNSGLWNDSLFALDKNVAITLEAPHSETLKKIDFVEKGQKKHGAWTVGLTETSQGGLGLFINLQDNSQYHKHDVCIGKVIDGFDTLQQLTRIVRGSEEVRIRKATASHLTRRESAGLV